MGLFTKKSDNRQSVEKGEMSLHELCALIKTNERRAKTFGYQLKKIEPHPGVVVGIIKREGVLLQQKEYKMPFAPMRDAYMHVDFFEFLNQVEHKLKEIFETKLDGYIFEVREIVFNGCETEADVRAEHISEDQEREDYRDICKWAIQKDIPVADVAKAIKAIGLLTWKLQEYITDGLEVK